jgi:hypothetical protein
LNPSARAAALMRSNAPATSGRIGLPMRHLFGAIPVVTSGRLGT